MYKIKNQVEEIKKDERYRVVSEEEIEEIVEVKNIGKKFKRSIEAIRYIESINIYKDIEGKECFFIEGNKVKLVKSTKNNKYLYVSINPKSKQFYFLTIYNIISIIYQTNNLNKIVKIIMYLFNIEVEEEEWKREQIEILKNNIEQISERNLKEYKVLYKTIRRRLAVLERHYIESINLLRGLSESVEGKAIVKISSNYIVKVLKDINPVEYKISQSTVSRHLNYFTLIGLLRKAKYEEIPKHLIKEEREIRHKEEFNTNFYIVEEITDKRLRQAERIVLEAKSNRITPSTITSKKVLEVFGYDKTIELYSNSFIRTQHSVKTREKNRIKETERMMKVRDIKLPF